MKKKLVPAMVMLLATLIFAQVDLEQGLVGYYSFDEITDFVVVNQASSGDKAPDGLLVEDPTTSETPEVVTGISGNALSFTTQNQAHVGLGVYDPSAQTDELAISCWIVWEGPDGNWQPIAGLRDGWDPPTTVGWSMVLDSGSSFLQFETNTTGGKIFIITSEPPTLGEWMHLVLNFDGGFATYYFNTNWMVEGDMQFGEGRSTSTFRIGAAWTGGNGFNGAIDEFRIYNRMLTGDEINFLFQHPGGAVDAVQTTPRIPEEFKLDQNFPNPFNPSTTLSYSLNRTDQVTLRLYNMLGENIATLVDEVQNAGQYSIPFDAEQLPGGIYMYQLNVGTTFEQTKKMLLLK